MKVLVMLNELRLRGKDRELEYGLNYLNRIVTRFYIDAYWKVWLLIFYTRLFLTFSTLKPFNWYEMTDFDTF
jgi:hypothetical protein